MNGTTRRHLLFLAPLLVVYTVVTAAASHPASDESSYLAYAKNLTHGFYSGRGNDVDLWFGPGLPLIVAPLSALGAPVELIRLLGPLLLFAAVVLFYFVLRLTTSPGAAFGGALAFGCYLPLLPLLPTLHSEIPAVLCVVGFMALFTIDLRRPRLLVLVLAAASLAALAVTRVVFGWILALVLVVALVTLAFKRAPGVKRMALVTALGLALTVPWLAYTFAVTGKPFYWSTSGGLSLYWMSSPHPGDLGDWHGSPEVLADARLAPHKPFFESLQGLNQVEFDEKVRTRALSLIREHPKEYVENVAANVSRLWFSTPFSYTPQKLSTTFYVLPNAFLLAGLVASFILLVRLRPIPTEAFGFAVLIVVGIAFQSLLSAYSRMLVPLVPLMVWFIVQAAFRRLDAGGPHDSAAADSKSYGRPAK